MIGPWQLLAQYYQGAKVKGLTDESGTGLKAWAIGAKYFLSKRTGVYATYNTIRNDTRAWGDYVGAGYSSALPSGALTATNAGADVVVWAVGIMHNF